MAPLIEPWTPQLSQYALSDASGNRWSPCWSSQPEPSLHSDADLVTIQDLLGHSRIKTTQRYCTVSNLKVQRDYFKAMQVIMNEEGGVRDMT